MLEIIQIIYNINKNFLRNYHKFILEWLKHPRLIWEVAINKF